jgi:hypothetical protein
MALYSDDLVSTVVSVFFVTTGSQYSQNFLGVPPSMKHQIVLAPSSGTGFLQKLLSKPDLG